MDASEANESDYYGVSGDGDGDGDEDSFAASESTATPIKAVAHPPQRIEQANPSAGTGHLSYASAVNESDSFDDDEDGEDDEDGMPHDDSAVSGGLDHSASGSFAASTPGGPAAASSAQRIPAPILSPGAGFAIEDMSGSNLGSPAPAPPTPTSPTPASPGSPPHGSGDATAPAKVHVPYTPSDQYNFSIASEEFGDASAAAALSPGSEDLDDDGDGEGLDDEEDDEEGLF
jgi:hypothetical protein